MQGQHTDETLWEALRSIGLDSTVESLPGGANLETILVCGTSRISRVAQDKRKPSSARGTSGKPTTHPLSPRQLRYLALARLIADSQKLRVVLIDEPPADDLWAEAVSKHDGSPSVGSAGEGAEATPQYGKSVPEILAGHFKECCVFIVAHHLASLRSCDRVWVLADGRKVGECLPSEIDTEQKFNRFIAICTEKPR